MGRRVTGWVWTAEGEAAGATVRTTADVAVALVWSVWSLSVSTPGRVRAPRQMCGAGLKRVRVPDQGSYRLRMWSRIQVPAGLRRLVPA
ncbi:hypothetical protein Psuf_009650 [Phytohabitans suffuscus]|uniref:Uncharacterized protein n=1 Tax=Phytohabitans suffuscus TaxID=624315 RepID=A0A6F8YC17_9ACTN|nr:hypothetical protein Psuf_009650 [Phytohabitans suffuscus]